MNAIIAALLADPAILGLHASTLARDIHERFDVSSCVAYAALGEAYRQAEDDGVMPMAVAR